jgi:hypothetical protein
VTSDISVDETRRKKRFPLLRKAFGLRDWSILFRTPRTFALSLRFLCTYIECLYRFYFLAETIFLFYNVFVRVTIF